ncbi:hypothetical protein N8303_06045 [Gammaproteobacteria bacterium]|nr:hypothetical protein [Gammaproteobacteria bacterium]
MTNQIIGYLMLVLSVLLYFVSAAALTAMIYAFTVNTTIAAVESAFGSMVIGLLFFVMAKFTFRAAKKRVGKEESLSQEKSV